VSQRFDFNPLLKRKERPGATWYSHTGVERSAGPNQTALTATG
jgi:hypothetical protein